MNNKKRISFSQYDCDHLYELAYSHFCFGCAECDHLKARLEKFIGKKEVAALKKILKKHPYCKANERENKTKNKKVVRNSRKYNV